MARSALLTHAPRRPGTHHGPAGPCRRPHLALGAWSQFWSRSSPAAPVQAASRHPIRPQFRTCAAARGPAGGEWESVLGATPHEVESRILRPASGVARAPRTRPSAVEPYVVSAPRGQRPAPTTAGSGDRPLAREASRRLPVERLALRLRGGGQRLSGPSVRRHPTRGIRARIWRAVPAPHRVRHACRRPTRLRGGRPASGGC